MYNYRLGVGLDLGLRINNLMCNKMPNFRSTANIDDIDEETSELHFIFFGNYNHSFCKLEIHTNEVIQGKFGIEVFAESEYTDFDQVDFDNFRIDKVLEKYHHLVPIITESVIHHPNDLQGITRAAERKIKIRFRVFDGNYEANEDYTYDFDLEEISKESEPYIQALYEIQNELKPNR